MISHEHLVIALSQIVAERRLCEHLLERAKRWDDETSRQAALAQHAYEDARDGQTTAAPQTFIEGYAEADAEHHRSREAITTIQRDLNAAVARERVIEMALGKVHRRGAEGAEKTSD